MALIRPRSAAFSQVFRTIGPTVGLVALLAIAGAWAYATSVDGILLLDDTNSIENNPTIRQLWPPAIVVPLEATVAGRPVANFSLAVNYALAPRDVRDVFYPIGPGDQAERFRRNVWGYHALNLLIHVAAALTLFGVVRRTLASRRMPASLVRAARWLSLAVALIWLVHPLQTGAVTYVVQRVESLMSLFYLLTLYCAIRAREGPRWLLWTLSAVASCALAMGSKEAAASAPLIVVCWDFVFGVRDEPNRDVARAQPKGRRGRRASVAPAPKAIPRWPIYAGLASTWIFLAYLISQQQRAHSVGFVLDGWTPWTYLLTQSGVILHYLRLSIVPAPLSFMYAWPMATSFGQVALPFAVVALLVLASVVGLARRHPLGFAGVWVFAILAPSSSVLPIITEVVAEHRMYLPLAAIVTTAVAGAYLLGHAILTRGLGNPVVRARVGAGLGVALTAGLVLTFGVETRARNRDYSSHDRIWRDTIAKQPSEPRAYVDYSFSLMDAGRYAEAESVLLTAVHLNDGNPLALAELGKVEMVLGQADEAIGHLEKALAIWPTLGDAHRSLGLAYAARGDDAKAFPHLVSAVQEMPNDPLILSRLAKIAATSNDPSLHRPQLALELSERAVRATSGREPALLDQLAAAQAGMDRFDAAVATSTEALRVARTQGDPARIAALEQRLALFQSLLKERGGR